MTGRSGAALGRMPGRTYSLRMPERLRAWYREHLGLAIQMSIEP